MTLRDLMIGLGLISVGLALAKIATVPPATTGFADAFRCVSAWLFAGVSIGAGFGTILKRPVYYAVVGLALFVLIPCLLFP